MSSIERAKRGTPGPSFRPEGARSARGPPGLPRRGAPGRGAENAPSPERAGKASIRESPVRRPAGRILRWALRVLLVLGAAELSLWAAAWGLARFLGTAHGSGRGGEILCAGDSCTFGIGAPRGRSYPDQLRLLFAGGGDAREVVNLGQAGFSSRQIVDRLERAVALSRPSYVLFLGGVNDAARSDLFLEGRRARAASLPEKALALLRRLRTVRLLEAAAGGLRGSGPASEGEEAEEEGDLLPSLVRAWTSEDVPRIERRFARLLRSPDLESLRRSLPFPLEVYRWELEMLRRVEPPEPLDPRGRVGLDHAYAWFTQAYHRLSAGRPEEGRAILGFLRSLAPDPPTRFYLRLHEGWASLLERDFERADRELEELLEDILEVSFPLGLTHALGGAALARLLRAPETRVADLRTEVEAAWGECERRPAAPIGREWMAVADWVDAIKGGDPAAVSSARKEALARFGPRPATRALRHLLDSAAPLDFARLRAELPLEPPRASYLGPTRLFWPPLGREEVDRRLAPNLERLARLATEKGLRVIVLTYLVDNASGVNGRLRSFAREQGWPLVDLEAARPGPGGETAGGYLSIDRFHPNESGYALVARAVFERVRDLERNR